MMQLRGFAIIGRLVMVLGGLLLLALACASIAAMFRGGTPFSGQLGGHDVALTVASMAAWKRSAIAVGAGLVAWLSLASAHAGVRGPAGLFMLPAFPVGDVPRAGQLLVSAKSMATIANVVADRVPGVVTCRSRVSLGPRGWRVDLRLVVERGIGLPALTLELRDALSQSLAAHTGVGLSRVRLRAQLEPLGAQRRVA